MYAYFVCFKPDVFIMYSVTKCIGSVLYCSLLVQCSRGFSFSRTARPHLAYIVLTCSRGANNNEVGVARVLCLVI